MDKPVFYVFFFSIVLINFSLISSIKKETKLSVKPYDNVGYKIFRAKCLKIRNDFDSIIKNQFYQREISGERSEEVSNMLMRVFEDVLPENKEQYPNSVSDFNSTVKHRSLDHDHDIESLFSISFYKIREVYRDYLKSFEKVQLINASEKLLLDLERKIDNIEKDAKDQLNEMFKAKSEIKLNESKLEKENESQLKEEVKIEERAPSERIKSNESKLEKENEGQLKEEVKIEETAPRKRASSVNLFSLKEEVEKKERAQRKRALSVDLFPSLKTKERTKLEIKLNESKLKEEVEIEEKAPSERKESEIKLNSSIPDPKLNSSFLKKFFSNKMSIFKIGLFAFSALGGAIIAYKKFFSKTSQVFQKDLSMPQNNINNS